MEIINNGAGFPDDEKYSKIERWDEKTTTELAKHYKAILDLIGEDISREGIIDTPVRVAKSIQFLTQGYNHKPELI